MALTFNIDGRVVNRDWLRIVARMRVLRALQPELTEAEVRVLAERAYLASLPALSER